MIGWIVLAGFAAFVLYNCYCRLRYIYRERNGLNQISPKEAIIQVMEENTWMTNVSIRHLANQKFAGKISTYNGRMPENTYIITLHELEKSRKVVSAFVTDLVKKGLINSLEASKPPFCYGGARAKFYKLMRVEEVLHPTSSQIMPKV